MQENFTDFDVIRMDEAPEVEIYIVTSDHPPGGFGETAVPPIAPAVFAPVRLKEPNSTP